jgi:uncharacterized membrane protein YtjA (UPF0391 family)
MASSRGVPILRFGWETRVPLGWEVTNALLGDSVLDHSARGCVPRFAGVATAAAGIAQILFYIFLVMFLVTLIMGLGRRGTRV